MGIVAQILPEAVILSGPDQSNLGYFICFYCFKGREREKDEQCDD